MEKNLKCKNRHFNLLPGSAPERESSKTKNNTNESGKLKAINYLVSETVRRRL